MRDRSGIGGEMDVIAWLLKEDNPSVRYRTLAELLDKGDTAEALEARLAIPASKTVVPSLGDRMEKVH